MSSPYIIWTLRRTGGTTLAGLLAVLSEHSGVQHEPFNPERVFGAVTKGWFEHKDEDLLRADLKRVLAKRPLLEVSTELGYVQIVLDREAEVDRILSLELARLTGAWGKQEAWKVFQDLQNGTAQAAPFDAPGAVAHLKVCQTYRHKIKTLMDDHGITPFVVYFEQVYSDPQKGRQKVADLLDFLGINPADHGNYNALLTVALTQKGQKSGRILDFVPNLDTTRIQLEEALGDAPFRF